MKVLGEINKQSSRKGFIVELHADEMEVICNKTCTEVDRGIRVGSVLDISKRFRHSQAVLDRVQEASTLPNQLRTLADTLELAAPALKSIEDAEEKREVAA